MIYECSVAYGNGQSACVDIFGGHVNLCSLCFDNVHAATEHCSIDICDSARSSARYSIFICLRCAPLDMYTSTIVPAVAMYNEVFKTNMSIRKYLIMIGVGL